MRVNQDDNIASGKSNKLKFKRFRQVTMKAKMIKNQKIKTRKKKFFMVFSSKIENGIELKKLNKSNSGRCKRMSSFGNQAIAK